MQKRPPVLVGVIVVVAALSVAWMMALREGSRIAGEFEPLSEGNGAVASHAGSDWSKVQLQSDAPVRFSLDGPATAASMLLPPGVAMPASAVERPVAEGDALRFCAANAVAADATIQVGDRVLTFVAMPPCGL